MRKAQQNQRKKKWCYLDAMVVPETNEEQMPTKKAEVAAC